jgi:hypothetical protein
LARPRHHAQNEWAIEDLKNLPVELEAIRARLPADTEIELWSQDPDWRARQRRNHL